MNLGAAGRHERRHWTGSRPAFDRLYQLGHDGQPYVGTDYLARRAYEAGAVDRVRARASNPSAVDILGAFAPAAALALGTGVGERAPRKQAPMLTAATPEYIVYSSGPKPARAREARAPHEEFLERGRDLEPVGDIGARYEDLVARFGDPIPGAALWDDKSSQVAWLIEFSDGTWATISDFETDVAPEAIVNWRVEGFDEQALKNVQSVIVRQSNMARKRNLMR